MSEKEKRDFYVAMCKCCLLAQSMKACLSCRFKIGLAEQEKPVDALGIPLPVTTQISVPIASDVQPVALHA